MDRLDLDADSRIRELVETEAIRRTKRLKRERDAALAKVPRWWVREPAHFAGGWAIGMTAATALGLPVWAPIVGVTLGVFAKETFVDRGKKPFYKHAVDVLAWVAGAAGGALIGG
jgi:hypothetical protein